MSSQMSWLWGVPLDAYAASVALAIALVTTTLWMVVVKRVLLVWLAGFAIGGLSAPSSEPSSSSRASRGSVEQTPVKADSVGGVSRRASRGEASDRGSSPQRSPRPSTQRLSAGARASRKSVSPTVSRAASMEAAVPPPPSKDANAEMDREAEHVNAVLTTKSMTCTTTQALERLFATTAFQKWYAENRDELDGFATFRRTQSAWLRAAQLVVALLGFFVLPFKIFSDAGAGASASLVGTEHRTLFQMLFYASDGRVERRGVFYWVTSWAVETVVGLARWGVSGLTRLWGGADRPNTPFVVYADSVSSPSATLGDHVVWLGLLWIVAAFFTSFVMHPRCADSASLCWVCFVTMMCFISPDDFAFGAGFATLILVVAFKVVWAHG